MKKNILTLTSLLMTALYLTGCVTASGQSVNSQASSSIHSADAQTEDSKTPKQIAVILPLKGKYGSLGQSVRSGFLSAYFANLANTKEQKVKFYDSSEAANAADLYQQALHDGADFVIGPLDKKQVAQISLASPFKIPVLALNYTHASRHAVNNFYEFGLLPEDEAREVATHAQHRGALKALVITENNEQRKRMANAFTTHWESLGGSVTESWEFDKNTNLRKQIATLLNSNPDAKQIKNNADNDPAVKYRRDDFDVVILFTEPKSAQSILPLLRFNYVTNVPVYASSSVMNNQHLASQGIDLNGVTICDMPWNSLSNKKDFTQKSRFHAIGKDAYLLSQSIKQLHEQPALPVYGATGTLLLTENQQIHRHLPCQTM